jgi:hypothetical protein
MLKQTAYSIRKAHSRLHKENIPHMCREYYQIEAKTLYEELGKDPQSYPILLFSYKEGIWN